ncbi:MULTISPECIES: cation:proton antiporter domain-containing protein [unclassified Xanthobacter]|uniref:cation:proton antiporter domain-containing protein n=1 Tax=unclassified Xanthobacter TaxID=2623496 RepID=UPI001EDECF69
MGDAVLKDAFVYLLAAGILVPLFHRARIGAVVGFIVVGAVLGPHGLGRWAHDFSWIQFITISSTERVAPFGELGVVFLLFLLGLEFSAGRLWALRREVFGIGGIQVLFCGIALTLAALGAGVDDPGLAMVLGFALALSSTAVVTQILVEEHRSLAPLGQLVIAVLLFQDLMVVPILLATELIAGGGGNVLMLAASALAKAVAAVAAILIAGRYVMAPLVGMAGSTRSRALIMAITLVVVVGTAGITRAAGLSGALGAFLAGMLLSETAYRHQIEVDLEPFKGLLIGVFFVTVGMEVDFAAVLPRLPLILAATVGLLVVKSAVNFGALRVMRVQKADAAEASILLAQTGEFALVVLGLLVAKGAVTSAEAGLLVAMVGLSLAATPFLGRIGRRLGRQLEAQAHDHLLAAGEAHSRDHVIIAGFGRVGRMVAEALEREEIAFIAVDSDPRRVALERSSGRAVYFGDASREEILDRLGIDAARAVMVTLDNPAAAERLVAGVRRRWPTVPVVTRAKDLDHARRLANLGVSGVIPETVEASLQLLTRLLTAIGLPETVVAERIADARAREEAGIQQPPA